VYFYGFVERLCVGLVNDTCVVRLRVNTYLLK